MLIVYFVVDIDMSSKAKNCTKLLYIYRTCKCVL